MMKPLRMIFIGTALAGALSVSALGASSGAATVDASALNLRAEADISSERLDVAEHDSAVIVLEETDSEWVRVFYDGQAGYMYSEYLEQTETLESLFGTGSVIGTSVILKSEASENGEALATYQEGDAVTVTGVSGEWYEVTADELVGYIHSDYLVLDTDANTTIIGTVSDTSASMRSETSSDSSVLDEYELGDAVTVTGINDDWYQVTADDQTGYVYNAELVLKSRVANGTGEGQTIVDAAMGYLGVPYVYGGTSPSGFDCSGLVYYLYTQIGYSVNRTAATLMSNGVEVEYGNLQPGDLVFFANGSGGSIGHVGIYIGDNQFIHASSGSGYIRTDNLSSTYYANYYAGARRIITTAENAI